MAEINITNENFKQEVLSADKPVLVDFWATWCGPCKMLGPVIAEIADENEGKIKVCKVNVDECPELASQYNIASIPTVVLFKDGQVADVSLGYTPKDQLLKMI